MLKKKIKINSVVVAWIDPSREQIDRRRIFPLVQSLLGSIVCMCMCVATNDSISFITSATLFFFMFFTSSVWFALSEIFLLIGSNNNNNRKKKNKNHRDNNGQWNDHVPYTCCALSSCHRRTHSYRWPRSRRIYTYFSLNLFCSLPPIIVCWPIV